jgi:hypothetical protein
MPSRAAALIRWIQSLRKLLAILRRREADYGVKLLLLALQ